MLLKLPEDTFRAYNRFLKKGNYRKAYQCLENLHHEFPDDEELIEEIVKLCLLQWEEFKVARRWLVKLIKMRSLWIDYAQLSRIEAELKNITRAKEYLRKAKELEKKQKWAEITGGNKGIIVELEEFIKYAESCLHSERKTESLVDEGDKVTAVKPKISSRQSHAKSSPPLETVSKSLPLPEEKIKSPVKKEEQEDRTISSFNIPIEFLPVNEVVFKDFQSASISPLKEVLLLIAYTQLTVQGSFDELLCLNVTNNVEKYWYQIETVKKVLKYFHGRVLLCDEVGLGKTIEAGMLIKEYLMRNMVQSVLILTPPSLVLQWKEELSVKFNIEFSTTDDIEFTKDSQGFWQKKFIIASLNTAKSKKHIPEIINRFYDIVVVDEAHHLKNRTTLAWELVNQIKKRFIFLLTATPVQNNLIELFNLITLLAPGQFKTEKLFRQEYLKKGNSRVPVNKEKLRELLKDVMVRNTRSVIDIKLPKRFASTIKIEPVPIEREIYMRLNEYLKNCNLKKIVINLLLREVGSSPFALRGSVVNLGGADAVKKITDLIDCLDEISKGKALIDLILKNPGEKKIIFTQYFKSMDYITNLLTKYDVSYVTFRGDMSTSDKNSAVARFKDEAPVLVSTESGGEGRNMQFCNTIINFDLPWNPMRIEQRIGRLHRIGQKRDVFIFNLAVKETIEDYIIEILENKINMFEMVIGEIEPILGYLGREEEFEDIVLEIWLRSRTNEEMRENFEKFGSELLEAKKEYVKAKVLDEDIFGEDYEI